MHKVEKLGQIDPDNKKIKDMITHKSGNAGGLLVGNRHSEGGIKAINKSTNTPLEMEGGEVVITRNAVSDDKKREFEGEMLTNREILSKINEEGGGVSFEEGGEVNKPIMSHGGKVDLQTMLVSELPQPIVIEEKVEVKETPIEEEQMPQIINNFQVGTIVYAVSSNGSVDNWTITQFEREGLHLMHTPKSPLSTKMGDRFVSYNELLDLFRNNLISIKGYKTFDELDLTIFLLKHRVGRYQTYFEEGGALVDIGSSNDMEETILMANQFGENKKFD